MEKTSDFFVLFWSSCTGSVLISALLAAFVTFIVTRGEGYGLPLAAACFAAVNANVNLLRQKEAFNPWIIVAPLGSSNTVTRYVFYWGLISLTGLCTVSLVKVSGVQTFLGILEAFCIHIVVFGVVLFVRNSVLSLIHGFKAMTLDWIFLSLFCVIPLGVFFCLYLVRHTGYVLPTNLWNVSKMSRL